MPQHNHTPPPWPEGLAIPIGAGDERYTFNGRPPLEACRVLSEGDYQYARHCVNAYDALLAAAEMGLAVIRWAATGMDADGQGRCKPAIGRLLAAIANAEPPVQENPQSEPEKGQGNE